MHDVVRDESLHSQWFEIRGDVGAEFRAIALLRRRQYILLQSEP